MKVMTLICALAMIAATHSAIAAVHSQPAQGRQAQGIRIHDLPGVRVVATLESAKAHRPSNEAIASTGAPRVIDLPAVKVYADDAQVMQLRAAPAHATLAASPARTSRGVSLQRSFTTATDLHASTGCDNRWHAMVCVVRTRLSRVWPVSRCALAESTSAAASRIELGEGSSVRR